MMQSDSFNEKIKISILILSLFVISLYSFKISLNLFFMAVIPALMIYYRYILQKLKVDPIIFAPLPAFLITVFLLIFVDDIRDSFYKYILNNIDNVINSLKSMPEYDLNININQIASKKQEFALTILYLIPSVSYVYISFMTLIAKRVVLFKMGNFSDFFRVPFHMVWILIIGGFTFLSDTLEIKIISYNTFIIFTYLYFLQGSNLISIILTKKRLFWLRFIILILILIHPYIIVAIAFIGLFDNWFDFASVGKDDSKN